MVKCTGALFIITMYKLAFRTFVGLNLLSCGGVEVRSGAACKGGKQKERRGGRGRKSGLVLVWDAEFARGRRKVNKKYEV